jgi:glycerol-3-phosphate dehydrogenase (NAD(P)+)
MVVPTPFVARTLAAVADKFRPDGILVSCTKGILNDTLETREQRGEGALPSPQHVCWPQ